MSTQQQDPFWNAGATEIQQLNPGGPDQKQSLKPQPTLLTVFGRSLHWVWGRVQLKRAAMLLTACSLSHNIYVVSSSFIMNDYFSKLSLHFLHEEELRFLHEEATQWAHKEDSDQTGRIPRLMWVYPGRTCHFVWFVVLNSISFSFSLKKETEYNQQNKYGLDSLKVELTYIMSRLPVKSRRIQTLLERVHFWKGDPLEEKKAHKIWTYQPRFYWVCSWALIINVTRLTPSSKFLSSIVYSKYPRVSSLTQRTRKYKLHYIKVDGGFVGPP